MSAPEIDSGFPDVEAQEVTEAERRNGGLKPIKENTPMEMLAGGVAGVAIMTSVAAMVIEQSAIVFVAGLLSSGIGPYAYYQQTQLTDIKALKETHEAIRREVDHLKMENERLEGSVEELTATVDRLEDVEEAFKIITDTQGQNVEEFTKQVETNKEILSKMKKNLKANVLQNLLSVIIRSDTDNDFVIDPEEIDDLITRIKRINGCNLNEGRFRDAIVKSGGNLKAVMDVVKNLLSDDVSSENQIFTITK